MAKRKIGIIGCGNIARGAHIPAYLKAEDAEIKYFCDIIPERAESCVRDYGCGIAVTDYKDVLADPEVDAISVCTPNLMHSIISIDAMRAGKDVLCEKPAARTYNEALAMQKAQQETGRVLNIGVCCRYNPAVDMVRAHIQNGDLGEVYHVFVNFRSHRSIPGIGGAFTDSSISGGGVLIDWGVHRLDQVLYCLGDPEPVSVSGAAYCKLGKDIENYVYRNMWAVENRDVNGVYDVDDSVSAFIRTTGPVITMEGAWAQNVEEHEDYLDFLGTKAGIRLRYCGGYTFYGVDEENRTFYQNKPEIPEGNMYESEINAFLRCTRTGEKDRAHIDNAIKTSRILQGIYDSSAAGREIVF